jgi:hypothetical protein
MTGFVPPAAFLLGLSIHTKMQQHESRFAMEPRASTATTPANAPKLRKTFTRIDTMKLFTATLLTQCPEFSLDQAIGLPGWSHTSGQWEKITVSWYPFENYARKIHFHASNRSQAAKQCVRAGLQIRDLDGGRKPLTTKTP